MNELETINSILPIIDVPRQIGKTTKLFEAARDLDGIFVVATVSAKLNLKNKYGHNEKIMTLSELGKDCRGYKGPVIFDTSALRSLFLDIREKLCIQNIANKKLTKAALLIDEVISKYDSEL